MARKTWNVPGQREVSAGLLKVLRMVSEMCFANKYTLGHTAAREPRLRKPARAIFASVVLNCAFYLAGNMDLSKTAYQAELKRSLLRLTRPTVFESAKENFFSTSRPILFSAAPCVASCTIDHDREGGPRGMKSTCKLASEVKENLLVIVDIGFSSREPRYSIDTTRLLFAVANRESCLLPAACCFNFETNKSIFFCLFILVQLIS